MTFNFGSLNPFQRTFAPVQRPNGPTNLAGNLMQQQGGGQQGGLGLSGAPMASSMTGGSPQPSTGGRIPVSGMPAGSLSGLFGQVDQAIANASKASTQPGAWITGSPPKTAAEAWAQQQADQKWLNKIAYQDSIYAMNAPHIPETSANGTPPPMPAPVFPDMLAAQKALNDRNFNGSTGMSPGTTEASAAAQKEAEAFLKSLGL